MHETPAEIMDRAMAADAALAAILANFVSHILGCESCARFFRDTYFPPGEGH